MRFAQGRRRHVSCADVLKLQLEKSIGTPPNRSKLLNPNRRLASLNTGTTENTGGSMKRVIYLAIFGAWSASCNAQGVGRLAEVTVVDCDSGATLVSHWYRGEYWVAGKPGSRYAIEIHNRSGERVLAVASVDGVNVLSGETAAWDQGGYVFGPREDYKIDGWRKTDQEVAAFTFTDSSDSYAGRTGRPENIGVIGVALFREQPPPPPAYSPWIRRHEASTPPTAGLRAQAPTNSADSAASAPYTTPVPPTASELAPKLGTGHGERESSWVSRTEFTRLQPRPNEVIRIHYDSFENLLAMGIVTRPRPVLPRADPFPASARQQYVPDPPG
jgi:hypothetical protein